MALAGDYDVIMILVSWVLRLRRERLNRWDRVRPARGLSETRKRIDVGLRFGSEGPSKVV